MFDLLSKAVYFTKLDLRSKYYQVRIAAGNSFCICVWLYIFGAMAIKTATFSLSVALFGLLAFIFGVIAENKKPAFGTAIPWKDVVICKFPSDPTVALGILSVAALALSTVIGLYSVFYSYKGKSVPRAALFESTTLVVFFGIAMSVSAFGASMLLWATVTEGLHRMNNVHHSLDYACPTAKTGLFGGAAFIALDASLFWLVCQMLTMNSREDYLEDDTKVDSNPVV
ncbi:hypothetical protein GIB67_027597 [Kingdonia uniflora]|uniref:Uncharacterized protein n=1 Tax=Kingdonia uniflora TaxID=39325 RepID=A0A7J7NKQ4_9MAGN|nr:hypothetical protein GIB67_027597 [Kingdonia uniflora]